MELILLLILYLLPTIIAASRKHNDVRFIFMVNLILGWTLLFWFVPLVWALTGNVRRKG